MFSVFLPVLILVGLTFTVQAFLLLRRQASVKADPTILQRGALDATVYQEEARKVSANFTNLFETPTLFYVAAVFAILFGATNAWTGILCWTYVLARVAHTVIHTTLNVVMIRFAAFGVSMLALLLLWVTLAFEAGGSLVFQLDEAEARRELLVEQGLGPALVPGYEAP